MYDELPIFDQDGQPIFNILKGRPAEYDGDGNLVREAIPDRQFQQMHRVPRMVEKLVTVKERVPRPGRRNHFGFDAAQIGDYFKSIDLDFGGYVVGEDGTRHLQYDQLISVLWKGLQELSAKQKELEQEIAQLKQPK